MIIGSGRLLAATTLYWTHLAVERQTVAPVRARAIALADNRLGELSAWDDGALLRTLQDTLLAPNGNETVDALGWTEDDVAALARRVNAVPLDVVDPITVTLPFTDQRAQARVSGFLRVLARLHPDHDTDGSRLVAHIKEVGE